MKIWMTAAAVLGLGTAAWGAELWDGCRAEVDRRLLNPQISAAKGELLASGTVTPDHGGYLVFSVPVTPFEFKDRSLALEMCAENPLPGDSFYVKTLDAKGRVNASFYMHGPAAQWTRLVCTPGRDSGGMTWFAKDVKAAADPVVVKLQFFAGRKSKDSTVKIRLRKLGLVSTPAAPRQIAARDYGIAVRGGTNRGAAAVQDALGRDAVVIWLMDDWNRRVLQIDAGSGKCESVPVPFSCNDAVYASLRSRTGKCYSLFGRHFAEYDPAQKKFSFVQKVPSSAGMAMEEDAQGVIWVAAFPDCALYSFDPAARKFTDCGVLNRENWNQYPRTVVAAPDGWVYVGIGNTAGQILAFNRKTGEKRALLTDGERIRPAMFFVRNFSDGNVYGRYNEVFYKLVNGTAVRCAAPDAKILWPPYTGAQGMVICDFPSGRKLQSVDLGEGKLILREKDGKTERTVAFSFENSGAHLMALDVNAEGIAAGGGFFPFYFGTLNPADGRKTDEFANVQCNTILACGKYFYIGGYNGGQILRYDPARPWDLREPLKRTEPDHKSNPVFYGRVTPHVHRPHTLAVTPDGKTLAMGGTPAYGMTGGGLALLDTASGKIRVMPHTELAENEAPFALAALSDQYLLVGTTTGPGTGGERKAKSASLLLVDIAAGKTVWHSKALGDISAVYGLVALPGGDALGVDSHSRLFRFRLASRQIKITEDVRQYGSFPVTQGPRLLLREGDALYLLFRSGVAMIDPDKGRITGFVQVSPEIQVGGAVRNGTLYYSGNRRWYSADIKEESIR